MKKSIVMVGVLLTIVCSGQASQKPKKEGLKIFCWKEEVCGYTMFNAKVCTDHNKKNQNYHSKVVWFGKTYRDIKQSSKYLTDYEKKILKMQCYALKMFENSGLKKATINYNY